MSRRTTVQAAGARVRVTVDEREQPYAEQGAKLLHVSAMDGTPIGQVERRVEPAWRKAGRLRYDTGGYSRWWTAQTTHEIAEAIADDEDRGGLALPRGLAGDVHRGVHLTRHGGAMHQSRKDALTLVVLAARKAGAIGAPEAPVLRIVDPGPIPLSDLPTGDDETLRADLSEAHFGGHNPDTVAFRLVEVALSEFHCPDPESYLLDDDTEGYERAVALADAYAAGLDVPPIVARVADTGQWETIDGWHRLSGAGRAHCPSILVYEPLS